MMPTIKIVAGGVSAEREVSLNSGKAIYRALSEVRDVQFIDLQQAELPEGIDPERDIICNALHGTFGEDGSFQALLEENQITYTGSDAKASKLCMDKASTKAVVSAAGVPTVKGIVFSALAKPCPQDLIDCLGELLVLKPVAEGSSVGLQTCKGADELAKILDELTEGNWLCETRVLGREFSVGILAGKATSIVEVFPQGGIYDFKHKYTAGATHYVCPASIPETMELQLKHDAETAFNACGCRDFARVDFMADVHGRHMLLEINTLPGMTETSLLPKTAAAVGISFQGLVQRLIAPAVERFQARMATANSNSLCQTT